MVCGCFVAVAFVVDDDDDGDDDVVALCIMLYSWQNDNIHSLNITVIFLFFLLLEGVLLECFLVYCDAHVYVFR